ncbi:MAG: Eco57I restriction-modification methylase domain-containing protein, partial [Fusobacterium sp.]
VFKEGGFDIVIGNPPYVIIFDKKLKKNLEENYETFRRNNDLYSAFFNKGIEILKENGKLGFITPNSFISGDYFKNLRELLINYQIVEIINFGNKLIFEDANVYSAITILNKTFAKDDWIMKSGIENIIGKIKINTVDFKVKNQVQEKVEKYPKFEDYFLVKDVGFNYWSVGRGKVRGESVGSRILYSGEKLNEKDIPYIKGSNFNKYSEISCSNYLKYNYTEFLNENDIFRYSPEILEIKPKIVYRQTSSELVGTLDEKGLYSDKTVHCIVNKENINFNLKYVLVIFNSKLLNYLYKQDTLESGRAFAQVKTVNVKKLPIKNISLEEQKPFIEKADIMLELNKELQNKIKKFKNRLSSNLDLKEFSKKMESFYELNFKEFLKELGKQKIKLSLSQQDEWEEYFEDYKNSILEIKQKISQTDKEIDLMIYKLYELTEEEIKIIEENF